MLQGALDRDPEALGQLIALLGPRLNALCRRLDASPEDAYQEAWAHLLARLHRFDPAGPASLATWSTRVVHRHLVDRHRRRAVRRIVALVDPGVMDEEQAGGGLSPEQDVARRRQRRGLEAALARLPMDQRRVVVLHHIHGLELRDIAEGEGLAVGTVKSRLHRGRARLAELLGDEGGEGR